MLTSTALSNSVSSCKAHALHICTSTILYYTKNKFGTEILIFLDMNTEYPRISQFRPVVALLVYFTNNSFCIHSVTISHVIS